METDATTFLASSLIQCERAVHCSKIQYRTYIPHMMYKYVHIIPATVHSFNDIMISGAPLIINARLPHARCYFMKKFSLASQFWVSVFLQLKDSLAISMFEIVKRILVPINSI